MPAATQPVITKKQTPIAKKERALPLHRELTQTQEEVVDLVSQILFQGGRREEVMPFLKALYRHQFRTAVSTVPTSIPRRNGKQTRSKWAKVKPRMRSVGRRLKRPTDDNYISLFEEN